MVRVGVILPSFSQSLVPIDDNSTPQTEFVAVINETSARVIHSGLAPSWARGGGARISACLAAVAQRHDFDAFYVTSEDTGLLAGLLLRASGWKGRLVVVAHAVRSAKRKAAMKAIGRRVITEVVCVSETQRQVLIEQAGFSAGRVHWHANWVDTDFFRPSTAPGEYVFACGLENRDYRTLLEAASKTNLPYIVAASGFFGRDNALEANSPSNVRVLKEKVPWTSLRDLYSNARFVVLPLNAVDYGAGVTGLVEAWATAKSVIATASPGIAEYLGEQERGLSVPPHDPDAMAHSIEALWNSPERCEAIGWKNRAWAERNASVKHYARMISELMH